MVNCGDRRNFWVMILKGTCCTHHYLSVPIFYLWDKEMLVKVRAAIWNHKMKVCTAKHPNGRQLGPQQQEAVLPVLDHWWRILHERQWYFYLASVYCILESVYDSCLTCILMNGTTICLVSPKASPDGWGTALKKVSGNRELNSPTPHFCTHYLRHVKWQQCQTERTTTFICCREFMQKLEKFFLALIYSGRPWNSLSSSYKRLVFLMSKHSLCRLFYWDGFDSSLTRGRKHF